MGHLRLIRPNDPPKEFKERVPTEKNQYGKSIRYSEAIRFLF